MAAVSKRKRRGRRFWTKPRVNTTTNHYTPRPALPGVLFADNGRRILENRPRARGRTVCLVLLAGYKTYKWTLEGHYSLRTT